ncbi:hypothetical protein HYPSUDRAFT_204608 [Hypholoma sublateritium FD-334 SS-4]|uniref:F-box domain-containing protein n=1 Tax=Hypholoma sublateritium (strain FD-334 SS-4) TaxID=945553 RepID=A0A0D2NRR6_HYPSF|nr:hypothetical protein HYPSUDRAFT_204608 [Hypholoma sublateritium FD-334 SS-4]
MSALPVYSPIQRLDFDVLTCIFGMNADMFDDHRALETTLATSRVCRDWRSCILGTTSIWAHLIDFSDRNLRTAKGINELMRRSGISLRWIKVPYLPSFRREWAGFILLAVGEDLRRTQKLEVTIGGDHVDLWSQLYHPAPHLKSFGITFTQEWSKFNNIFSSLFGGSAPMLHELRFKGHRSNFTVRPSWLHQLRSLDLRVDLTVSEMLEVLMSTSNLVILRFDKLLANHNHTTLTLLANHTTSTFPFVSLPKLTHLEIKLHGELNPGALLLDHMCIPPDCSIDISATWTNLAEIDNKSIFTHIIRAISSCARLHFIHRPPQQLWLTIMPGYFFLQTATHSHGPSFKFGVGLKSMHVFPTHTLSILLSEFALPGLSEVTWSRFKITGMNRPIPGFTVFMRSLPAVRVIGTDKYSLRHLRAWSALKGVDTGPRIGFPALEILKLDSVLPSHSYRSKFDSVPDPVSTYVKARIARGHALSIIDCTNDELHVLPDMKFLRKAVGLKVRWRQRGVAEIREYICGTGPPQKVESV